MKKAKQPTVPVSRETLLHMWDMKWIKNIDVTLTANGLRELRRGMKRLEALINEP